LENVDHHHDLRVHDLHGRVDALLGKLRDAGTAVIAVKSVIVPVAYVPTQLDQASSSWGTMMNALILLIARFLQFFTGGGDKRRSTSENIEQEKEALGGNRFVRARNFDDDYREATELLKTRMDRRFPDNYRAKLGTEGSGTYDHGQDRAAAVDTMSSEIATALRDGATVRQAAEAGAAGAGI
jgi:hypothetical protein